MSPDTLERQVRHWVRLYDNGHVRYNQAVEALAELGCGDEDIVLCIGLDPDAIPERAPT